MAALSLNEATLSVWHQPTDTVENVDPDVVARTEAFLWELLREMD